MAFEARLDKIPNFIKAKTAQGLRRHMLINNVQHAKQFVYHDIQFVNGEWYAWFYLTATISELTNGGNDRSGEA